MIFETNVLVDLSNLFRIQNRMTQLNLFPVHYGLSYNKPSAGAMNKNIEKKTKSRHQTPTRRKNVE